MVIIPDGWKLVPIEPTKEMLEDGFAALYKREGRYAGVITERSTICKIYKTMIGLVPKLPRQDEETR